MQPDADGYLYGTVTFVDTGRAGSELASDHASGVQLLVVLDSSEFPETGSVKVGGPTGDLFAYDFTTSIEDPDDVSAVESVHLTTATSTAYDAGTPVVAWPLREHKTALVQLDDPDPSDPTGLLDVVIPHKFQHLIEPGPRETGGEQVALVHRHGQWRIDEVFGQAPTVQADYLTGTIRNPLALADGVDIHASDGTPLAGQIATNTADIGALMASGAGTSGMDGGLVIDGGRM